MSVSTRLLMVMLDKVPPVVPGCPGGGALIQTPAVVAVGERDVGLSVAIDVAVDGDVAPAETGQYPPRGGIDGDGRALQYWCELDDPCAGVVVRSHDRFLERSEERRVGKDGRA